MAEKPPELKIEVQRDPRNEFFIDVCVKGAEDIRRKLGFNEGSYLMTHPMAHSDSRGYYIYSVLDEIEKAGVALIRYQEFLSEGSSGQDRVSRNIITSLMDEQMVWVRKLTEIFVDSILFLDTNTQERFKHYLLVKHLERIRKEIKDLEEFFGCENLNLGKQESDLITAIRRLEVSGFLGGCWYLQKRKRGGGRQLGEKAKLTPFKERFDEAVSHATKDQKLTLGLTYDRAFGKPSGDLHYSPSGIDGDFSLQRIDKGIGRIGLLAAHILTLCRQLIGDRRRKGFAAQLARVFRSKGGSNELFEKLANPKIKRGDFVIAAGDFAEVVSTKRSKFGYRSFKLKYLSTPPIPSITSDEFPAFAVRKLYDGRFLRSKVRAELQKHGSAIGNISIAKSLRESALHLWEKVGLKEAFQGRRDLQIKKMKEEIKRLAHLKKTG